MIFNAMQSALHLPLWIFAHAPLGSSQRGLATNQMDKQVQTKGEPHAWQKCWTGWIGNSNAIGILQILQNLTSRNPLTWHDSHSSSWKCGSSPHFADLRIVEAMGQGHSSDLHPLNILSFCDWPHRGICTQLSPALRSSLQLEDGQGHLVFGF